MNNFLRLLLITLLVIFALIGAYFIGHKAGEDKIKTTLINNTETVKQIAELASLEVTGISEINLTNNQPNSLLGTLNNLFFENTINLRIPYTAKYGVDVQNLKLNLQRTDTTLNIYLPSTKLLSYELKLDKSQTLSKSGWLIVEDYTFLQQAQSKLYLKSREELEINTAHIKHAKINIAKTLKNYFEPFGFKVHIYFDKKLVDDTALESIKS